MCVCMCKENEKMFAKVVIIILFFGEIQMIFTFSFVLFWIFFFQIYSVSAIIKIISCY